MFKLFLTFFHILDETTASCAVCYEACLHFGWEEGDTTQRACSSPPGDRVSLLHYIHSLLAKGTCLWWSSSSFLLTRLNEQAHFHQETEIGFFTVSLLHYIHSVFTKSTCLWWSWSKVDLLWQDSTSRHHHQETDITFSPVSLPHYIHSLVSDGLLVQSQSAFLLTRLNEPDRHELDFSSVSIIHSVHLLVKTCFLESQKKMLQSTHFPLATTREVVDVSLTCTSLSFIWTWTSDHFPLNFDVETFEDRQMFNIRLILLSTSQTTFTFIQTSLRKKVYMTHNDIFLSLNS